MMICSQRVQTRFRGLVGTVVIVALAAGCVIAGVTPAWAEESAAPVVGSFGVGGGLSGAVDERTGVFGLQVPVVLLPGLGGGAVDVGLSYDQGLAAAGVDRFSVGAGWGWSGSFVDVDGGLRVFPASGGVFNADASQPSGLDGYTLGDAVFSQEPGILPERSGVGVVAYAFSLAYVGGLTDYFDATGNMVARVDVFGARVDWVWELGESHRLTAVVDGGGSRAQFVWGETGVTLVGPQRSDGVSAVTVLEVVGGRLIAVTNPASERVGFEYRGDGLLTRIVSSSSSATSADADSNAGAGVGAVTEVSYQSLPDGSIGVDRVRVVDAPTGVELSVREWDVIGDHLSSGWPTYRAQGALWLSGDGEFRYQTQLSDGATRVVSEYNSLGLMVNRRMVVSSGAGDVVVQEQKHVFPGTESGGVSDPSLMPKNYQKPTNTQIVFRDDRGRTRQVSEETSFDDAGRITRQRAADGTTTETVYDSHISSGMVLPVGVVLEQKTTGPDGSVAKTVNTPTADRKAIAATETFVGASAHDITSQSRTEVSVGADGFVSEERLIATGETGEGPATVVTTFNRTVDDDAGTVSFSQTTAAGTAAASTVSTRIDHATGLTLSTTDAAGRTATTSYDAAGRVLTETDPTGLHTITEYANKVTTVTNPQGITQSEYVDSLGRVVKITDNITVTDEGVVVAIPGVERVVEERMYEQNSSQITVTDARGLKTVTVSDVFGRVVEVTAPNGVRQVSQYNDVANTVSTGLVADSGDLADAELVSTTVRNNTDQVVEETGTRADKIPVPQATTHYDGLGRVSEQVSADLSTRVVFNPDGTPKTTTQTPTKPEAFTGEPVSAEREYNLLGVSTKKTLTQPNGETRPGVSRVLDAAGQTVSETDQAGNTTVYEYTVDGLVAVVRNGATGVVTRNTYDPLTRARTFTETIAADGATTQTGFEYDPVTGNTVAVYDPIDRQSTQIGYVYDLLGNVTQISYPDGKTITHTFDEYGTETTSTDITGNITTYEYDKFGSLTHATQTSSEGVVLGQVGYMYDSFGRMMQLTRGNNVTTEYTFTSTDQIKTETTTHGNTTIFDASYEYDTHGNLTQSVETRGTVTEPGQEAQPAPVTETRTYTYDAYNRLTASSVYDGINSVGEPRLHTEYEINVSGDVTRETVTNPSAVTVREFEYNPLGHLTAVTTNGVRAQQEYDAAGNLTHSINGTNYTYNVFNQAITETSPDGSGFNNTYWVTGQHRTTTIPPDDASDTPPQTVGMYWDGATLVNDTHTSENVPATTTNTITGSYLISLSRHTRTLTRDGKAYSPQNATQNNDAGTPSTDYYVTDRHGSTTHLTTNTGGIGTAYTYTDYGQTTNTTQHQNNNRPDDASLQNAFQYAGEYTTSTGTQNLGDRVYDPTVMRFTTHDIAELHNLYAYANNNPITLVDPTGQTPNWDIVTSGILAFVGTIMAVIGLGFALWTGGTSLGFASSGFAILTALADTGVAISQAVDLAVDFIDDETSEILTWASLALGGASMFSGTGAKLAKTASGVEKISIGKAASDGVQRWADSCLYLDVTDLQVGNIQRVIIGYNLTDLESNEITLAMKYMMTNVRQHNKSGLEFLFVQRIQRGKFTEHVGVALMSERGSAITQFAGVKFPLRYGKEMPQATERTIRLRYRYDSTKSGFFPDEVPTYKVKHVRPGRGPVDEYGLFHFIEDQELRTVRISAKDRFDAFMRRKGVDLSSDTLLSTSAF